MKSMIFCLFSLLAVSAFGQGIKIKGRVTDYNNAALIGANVYLEGTYDGASTDTAGKFSFPTARKGTFRLTVSYLGYNTNQQEINLPGDQGPFDIKLAELSNQLNEVVITAGSYQAGDRKRGIQMTTLDVLTTANSNGDFIGAMNTLPGTQIVGDDGGLFVRGGDRSETKTFIDGLLVANPYTSKAPDLPTRGRFSPSLFRGTLFSTGGYSAEYGQALSAALILNTNNLIANNPQSINILPFGLGATLGKTFDSTAISINVGYFNMLPYFKVIPQTINWEKYPETRSADFILNSRLRPKTYLKVFSSAGFSNSAMELPSQIDPFGGRYYGLGNNDYYINAILTSRVKSVDLKTGVSWSYDKEDIDFKKASLLNVNNTFQVKQVAQLAVFKNVTLRTGAECYLQNYNQQFAQPDSFIDSRLRFANALTAIFGEAENKLGKKFSLRAGVRGEYASLNNEFTLSPRISMAYKTGAKSQVSAAYGYFNQLPKDEYMKFNNDLSSQQAIHYIVNYQYQNDGYLFRIEGYFKDYRKLTRVITAYDYSPGNYTSDGYGYAKGLDIFWRDQTTIPHVDYWVSFTLLDAKKKYENYPGLMYPTYFSRYNAAAVFKRYFAKLKTQASATYQFSSGRPYLDPCYVEHYTPALNNLSLSASYLTRIYGKFTVVFLSVNNVLGFDQVYGYHYYKINDGGTDTYQKIPIQSPSKRFYIIGLFISLHNNQF